ncbi:protein E6 [Hevea brasiliensis]|nr:protein E6 [Hevea brasiliensis]
MASFGKHLFFYFLLVLFSSSLIHARESKFFSKFTHYSITNNAKESNLSPIEAPAPTPAVALAPTPTTAPAPAPIYTLSEIGDHGLYGHGSGLFPPTKETTTENELLNEEFDGETYEKAYQTSNFNNNNGNYNYNNGYKLASESHETGNQNNYNGYTGRYNNNGYELASGSYEKGYNQNNRNSYTSNYNVNNGYLTDQRQGMSDTRFMEGGKYYYNVKNENSYYPANIYAPRKVSTQNQGYYGNSENQNEFNSMEFENQELYDEDSQEESLP